LINIITDDEFPSNIAEFITCFEPAGVKTLRDVMAWNEEHADIALPERE
jgi:hypothetical protein